jgi:hypothetical protein
MSPGPLVCKQVCNKLIHAAALAAIIIVFFEHVFNNLDD